MAIWNDPKDDNNGQVAQATVFGAAPAAAAAALAMRKKGASEKDIYDALKVWQHGDGTWRQEKFGPMSVADPTGNVAMSDFWKERYHPSAYVGQAADLIDAPHIYNAIPSLADIPAYSNASSGGTYGGRMPPNSQLPGGGIWLNERENPTYGRLETGAHEMYHAIDAHYGHPDGPAPPHAGAVGTDNYNKFLADNLASGMDPTAAHLDAVKDAAYSNSTHEVGARMSAARDMRWQGYNQQYGPQAATAMLESWPPWKDEDVPRSQQFVTNNADVGGGTYPALENAAKNMAPDANGAYPHKTAYAAALRDNGWKGSDKSVQGLFEQNGGILPAEHGGPQPTPISDSGKPVYRVPMGRQDMPPVWHEPDAEAPPEAPKGPVGNGASGAWKRYANPAPEAPPEAPRDPFKVSAGTPGVSDGASGIWGSPKAPPAPEAPQLPTSPTGPAVTSKALQGGPWTEAQHGTYVPTEPAPLPPTPPPPPESLLAKGWRLAGKVMPGDVATGVATFPASVASDLGNTQNTLDLAKLRPEQQKAYLDQANQAAWDHTLPGYAANWWNGTEKTPFPSMPYRGQNLDPILPTGHGDALTAVLAQTGGHPGQALASGDTQTGSTPAYDDKFAPDSPDNNNVTTGAPSGPQGTQMDPTNPYAPGGMNNTYQLGMAQQGANPWGGSTAAPPPPQYTGQAAPQGGPGGPQAHAGGGGMGGSMRPPAPQGAPQGAPPQQAQPNMGPGTPFGGQSQQAQQRPQQFGGQGQQGQNPISNLISGIVSLPLNVVQGITKGLGNYVNAMNQSPPPGYTNTPSQIQQASTNIANGGSAFPFGGQGGQPPMQQPNQSMANYQNTQPQATGWNNWNAGPGGY